MSKKVPLSVVVITKNEAERIDDCLKSASWANDLIVVDTGDVVMVCKKDQAQKVRQAVDQLKKSDEQHYLRLM